MFDAFHLRTCSGRNVQFLVLFGLSDIKKILELVDREFATKAAGENGRDGDLAVAWEIEISTIIDARGTEEEPLSDGLWNVQSKSLSSDGTILGNVIRQ